MRFGKTVLLGAALSAAACAGAVQAQTSGGAGAAEVQGLLNALGGTRGIAMINQRTAEIYSRNHPCVPAATVQQTFTSPQVEQQEIATVTAIYQRHFTSAEVQQLTQFFRSPVGQKWVQEMPRIAQESMQSGRQMGGERVRNMVAALQKQGVLDSQGQCPATRK